MTLSYTYDGAALTHKIAPSTVSLTSAAELGEPSMSGLQIEDPASTLTMLGHRPFVVAESACSQPRLFTGWVTERGLGRSVEDGMFGNAPARIHDVTLIDLNALFNWRLITGTDGDRPAETWAARLAWILGSDYLTGLIADTGYIAVNTTAMDAANYRDGYPAAVLGDLMDRTGGAYNYFAFWDPVALAVGLWVGHLDDAVSTSTLRISNVLADVDGVTTFAPDDGARLAITPTETYSEVTIEYAHGTRRLFRSRPATATKYIRRGSQVQRPYTGSAATASNQAERFLDLHANEQDRITVTIIVPAAAAGLLTAGQRLDVKFSHLAGYTSFTSMRCVRLTVTPTNNLATDYSLALELLAPRPATASASVVQSAFGSGSGGGIALKLPATPTLGNTLIFAITQRNAIALDMTSTEGPAMPTWTVVQNLYGQIAVLVKTVDGVHNHRLFPDDVNEYLVSSAVANGGWHWGLWEVAGLDISTLVSATATGSTGAMSVPLIPGRASSAFEIGVFEIRHDDVAVFAPPFYGVAGSGWTEDYAVAATVYHPSGLFEHRTVTSPNGVDSHPATGTRYEAAGANWYGVAIALTTSPDTEITLPPPPGTTVMTETPTPAPNGTTVLFTLANGYIAGSLAVRVDGLPIPASQVAETNPAAGTFTLSWAPDADEAITAMYLSA